MKRIDAEPIIEGLEALSYDLQNTNPEAAHAYITAANMLRSAPRIVYNAENRHCGECEYYIPIPPPRQTTLVYGNCAIGYKAGAAGRKSCMQFSPSRVTRLDIVHEMTVDEFAVFAEKLCRKAAGASEASPLFKRENWRKWAQKEVKRNGQ